MASAWPSGEFVKIAASVSWRYIGAKTRQWVENRAAWYWAIAICSGSIDVSALVVGCPLTVG